MGVVKDGTVSGILPDAEAFAVHYPGYPSTVSRALETLGGTDGIVEARSSSESKTLELRFRPEDPYSHPVIGKLQSCSNFLLKISKKTSVRIVDDASSGSLTMDRIQCDKKASFSGQSASGDPLVDQAEMIGNNQDQGDNESKTDICAEIVARVSQEYCFDGMADYQHVLPVHADAARKKKRKWADMDPYVQKSGIIDLDKDDLLMLVPPFFSAKDTPEQVVLKPSSTGSSTKKNFLQQLSDRHSSKIQERTFFVSFNVEDIPKKIEWEKSIPIPSYIRECQTAVCKLFDERPIWPKPSIKERLRDAGFKIPDNMMRRLLFNSAYYFSNGPFLKFWIRRGYDPRKDPSSSIYQRIDFRVPPSLRGFCDANAAQKYKQRWGDLCAFKCFPFGCQLSLQLFELEDDYIQQEIKKPLKETTCSRASGWFSFLMVNHLRLRIAVRFLSVCPEPGTEKLLKTFKNMFEKSKRRLIFEGDSRPDKTSDEKLCKEFTTEEEITDQQDHNKILSDEEENEEADVEPDDYEENEYEEELGMSGEEEDEIPLEPGSYNKISTDYLQNIFDTFPSAEPGISRIPNIEGSDEEYQIYEPLSDDDGNSDNEL